MDGSASGIYAWNYFNINFEFEFMFVILLD